MKPLWALALLSACGAQPLATVGDAGPAPAPLFVAAAADFAPFRSWRAVPLGQEPNTADPPGPRVAFVSAPPAGGAYPVGAILVKAIENTPAPAGWDLFAMAKRGGDFDPSGARGWEFFLLQLDGDTVSIVSRGTLLEGPGGMTYGSVGAIFCSGCHGAAGTERTDHVLSPVLAP